jgi:hypothetical protein
MFASCLILSAEANLTTIESGIFTENWGDAALVEDKLELWVALNISELEDEINNLMKFQNKILANCDRQVTNSLVISNNGCEFFKETSKSLTYIY